VSAPESLQQQAHLPAIHLLDDGPPRLHGASQRARLNTQGRAHHLHTNRHTQHASLSTAYTAHTTARGTAQQGIRTRLLRAGMFMVCAAVLKSSCTRLPRLQRQPAARPSPPSCAYLDSFMVDTASPATPCTPAITPAIMQLLPAAPSPASPY
jgi:hypothetical protein